MMRKKLIAVLSFLFLSVVLLSIGSHGAVIDIFSILGVCDQQQIIRSDTLIAVKQPLNNSMIDYFYSWFDLYQSQDYMAALSVVYPGYVVVRELLRAANFDPLFVNLAWVESEFNPDARSFMAAVGFWQFQAPTAWMVGLRTNQLDERQDIYASTLGFIKHFTWLYTKYGTIELALAAYNCGEGKLDKAIARTNLHDFWQLAASGAIPQQTAYYVPKFLAIAKWASSHEQNIDKQNLTGRPSVYVLRLYVTTEADKTALKNLFYGVEFIRNNNRHLRIIAGVKGALWVNIIADDRSMEKLSDLDSMKTGNGASIIHFSIPDERKKALVRMLNASLGAMIADAIGQGFEDLLKNCTPHY